MDKPSTPSVLRKLEALALIVYAGVVIAPYYVLVHLRPSGRGYPSWTLFQNLRIRMLGWGLSDFSPRFQEAVAWPLSYEPTQGELAKHKVGFTRAPIYEGQIFGEVGALAEKWEVKRIRVAAWWYGDGEDGTRTDYKAAEGEKIILFLHGGAFIVGGGHPDELNSYIPSQLASLSKTFRRAVSIDYRLSTLVPEQRWNSYPTALIDCISAFHYLLSLKFEPSNIIIAGDSAGGNLALALTRYLLVEEKIKVGGLILISPWGDLTTSRDDTKSSRAFNYGKDMFDEIVDAGSWAARAYLGGESAANAYISPACKTIQPTFEGFPRTYLTVGEMEVLLDDSRTLRERLQRAINGALTYEEQPRMPHDVFIFSCMDAERRQIINRIADWIDSDEKA
ncbi:alpha/beta-hydrolase [Calocera viscosa TUFC12733]|uniref:Alpha/beta-hydrolase n=1 Tax=Calocera viscosa (strain TUFC12733) TaxID=1330018 RepID=A0A167I2X5_CALVF|nr:alpha/beta-hydrolase [Calocera viscosa TUFC12733]